MPVVKILRHGQITLPKEIRKILGVEEGDLIELALENARVFLQPKILVRSLSSSMDMTQTRGSMVR